ncbi:unnamed protein product, partial [Staurois parvus]
MALGREGLISGAIKGLTVCCFTMRLCVFHCKHSAMHSHTKQCAGADRGEICIVDLQFSPSAEMQN